MVKMSFVGFLNRGAGGIPCGQIRRPARRPSLAQAVDRRPASAAHPRAHAGSLPTAIVLCAAFIVCHAPRALAYFEEIEPDARALALGSAVGADAMGPSALYWNPALLARPTGAAVQINSSHPYALSGLTVLSAFARVPTSRAPLAASWHTTRLADAINEDVVSVGAAHAWKALSVGAAVELARVSLAGQARSDLQGMASSVTHPSGTVGAAVTLPHAIDVAAVVRHVAEGDFSLLGENGADVGGGLRRQEEIAGRYGWNPASTVLAAVTHDDRGWRHELGGEVVFSDVFVLRAGLAKWQLTGGIGLRRSRWSVDVGFLTHADLGNSYRFSFALGSGGRS
jgi:hypothetical protein